MNIAINKKLTAFAAVLAAAIVGWLSKQGIIPAGQLEQATLELAGLIGTVFLAITAVIMWVGSQVVKKFFGGNSGKGGNTGGSGENVGALLFMATVLSMAGLGLSSCALSLTSDGCVLGSYTRDGRTYKAGPCVGPDGKADRLRVQWSNVEGQELRATVFLDKKRRTLIEYKVSEGIWIQWSSKSGVVVGPLPPDVETALENETALPVRPVVDVEAEVISTK